MTTTIVSCEAAMPVDRLQAIKARQQAMWASGDFAVIGTTLQIVGELLCEAADVGGGERVLDVAAGNGNATLAAARRFAHVTSTDYVPALLDGGRRRAEAEGLQVTFEVADAEALPYPDASFDHVYGHGVIQYTADPVQLIRECHRVVKSGGTGIFMVYNRVSWLNALSKVMKVKLEHEDAPCLRKFSIAEFRELLAPFADVRIVPERFPVKSRLHGGWKGLVYNTCFVGTFNTLPRSWVRPLGWHLMAFCRK